MIQTVIIGLDQARVVSLVKEVDKIFDGNLSTPDVTDNLADELEETKPGIILFDVSDGEQDSLLDSVLVTLNEFRNISPESILLISGKVKPELKKRLKAEEVVVSGVTIDKIVKDFQEAVREHIRINADMVKVLTHFFTPHLMGHYDTIGFDQVVNGSYSREEILPSIDVLHKRLAMFSEILTKDNKALLVNALEIIKKEDLNDETRRITRDAFSFQFTALSSLDNFSDERHYFAERDVISNVWESVIAFAREHGDGIIFGCSKNDATIKLKIAINQRYDLSKINKRSKIYQTLASIRPYGSVVVTCGDEQLVIGKPQNSLFSSEGLTFEFFFQVIVPVRRRRGLKRA